MPHVCRLLYNTHHKLLTQRTEVVAEIIVSYVGVSKNKQWIYDKDILIMSNFLVLLFFKERKFYLLSNYPKYDFR
uniref:Putative ovule protein n=1 Tax=Solanum chacoense TaxID=4108 RepID=A0A0V0GSA1_SOLCH